MGEDRHLLTDIRLIEQHSELRPVYGVDVDLRRVPSKAGTLVDIGVVSGEPNLVQAVIMRLLTPRGELAALGHPEYGSRLHELVGEQNTETKRNLVKLYILESLQMEPRIERVAEATVKPVQGKGNRDRVNVLLKVIPVGSTDVVTIGPFSLELEQ